MGPLLSFFTSNSATKAWTAASLGVLVHNGVFIRGEWHIRAPYVLLVHVLSPFVVLAVEYLTNSATLEASLRETAGMTISYAVCLSLSICIYRAFFHRLRTFSGPPLAKITKLWHVYNIWDGKNHLFLEDLREKYGEIIRTGPCELTVFHPDIHRLVDGPGNTCSKSGWYDVVHPDQSLVSARDKEIHNERRRLWFQGLGPHSLKEYERRMLDYVDQLDAVIERQHQSNTAVNVSDVFFWFCWDVMGETTFGKSFDMLKDERWHASIAMLRRALTILGPVTPTPWAFHIAFKFLKRHWVVHNWREMKKTCYKLVRERLSTENPKEDIFKALVASAKSKGLSNTEYQFLNGDAVVGLVAGSDPVAHTLVFLFLHIAKDEKLQAKLHEELSQVDVRNPNALKSCEYLNSVVNETLRVYPPLMTGGMRDTGQDGLDIGDVRIPGNVTIISPRFSVSRLESCFKRPNEFIPERWTSQSDLNPYPKAFNPFGIGAHSCVGKNIVCSEVRLATAALMSKYRVRLAPGETGRRVYDDLKDYVAPMPGQLDLKFEPRH